MCTWGWPRAALLLLSWMCMSSRTGWACLSVYLPFEQSLSESKWIEVNRSDSSIQIIPIEWPFRMAHRSLCFNWHRFFALPLSCPYKSPLQGGNPAEPPSRTPAYPLPPRKHLLMKCSWNAHEILFTLTSFDLIWIDFTRFQTILPA